MKPIHVEAAIDAAKVGATVAAGLVRALGRRSDGGAKITPAEWEAICQDARDAAVNVGLVASVADALKG